MERKLIKFGDFLNYFDPNGDDPIIQITDDDWDKYASMRSSHIITELLSDWYITELEIITGTEAEGDPYAIRVALKQNMDKE